MYVVDRYSGFDSNNHQQRETRTSYVVFRYSPFDSNSLQQRETRTRYVGFRYSHRYSNNIHLSHRHSNIIRRRETLTRMPSSGIPASIRITIKKEKRGQAMLSSGIDIDIRTIFYNVFTDIRISFGEEKRGQATLSSEKRRCILHLQKN